MKVYIAAPFFNDRQLEIVQNVEDMLSTFGIEYFSPRSAGTLKDMSKDQQKQTKKEIYDGNILNMDECTHMIACVEQKDSGTTFEIGYYAAQKKPIVLFSEVIGTVNVMLAEAALSICDDYTMLEDALDGEYSIEPEDLT